MFSFKVDEEISIELLQQHNKEELYELINPRINALTGLTGQFGSLGKRISKCG